MQEIEEKNAASDETRQLVTFKIGNEQLGLPIEYVQEIIRPPELNKVPNTSESIEGIGNLRGNILPIINLRTRLGLEEKAFDDSTRIVVLNVGGVSNGFIVDSVSEVISVDENKLEEPPSAISGIDGSMLKYVLHVEETNKIILILSEEKILPELDISKQITEEKNKILDANVSSTTKSSETSQVVAFKVKDEEFSFDIMKVKEIIRYTELTPIPKSPSYIIGLMSLRNSLLPVISLRELFELDSLENELEREFSDKMESISDNEDEETISALEEEFQNQKSLSIYLRRIVVIEINNIHIGVLVDSVSQVLRIENDLIAEAPPILQSKDMNRLKGVAKLNDGKRIIMLLEIEKLLDNLDFEVMNQSLGSEGYQDIKDTQQKVDEEVHLVCFKLSDEEYALEITKIQEIIRVVDITVVPHSSDYIKGIINLRGSVSPIVDMRSRFDMDEIEKSEQNRIVVVKVNDTSIGLLVDAVTEVLRLSKSLTETPPESINNNEDNLIKLIGKLDGGKRIVALIDETHIIKDSDLNLSDSPVNEEQAVAS